jgi:hypothetical protein
VAERLRQRVVRGALRQLTDVNATSSSLTVVIEAQSPPNRGSGQQLTMEDDHRAPVAVARRRTGGRRRR